MENLENLFDHITSRVNANIKRMGINVAPILEKTIPRKFHTLHHAYYAMTTYHPLSFKFTNSSLSGSHLLGRSEVDRSVVYKSIIRGDELKSKGDVVEFNDVKTTLFYDEVIRITNSFLMKVLVHNHSKNPEMPEVFNILNTVAMHFSNIHGTTTEGVYLGAFATVDFSIMHDCVVGNFAYVQADDLYGAIIEPGRVWVRYKDKYEFKYTYPQQVLEQYVSLDENSQLSGKISKFMEEREQDFIPASITLPPIPLENIKEGAYVSPYSVIKGESHIGENSLVAQGAHLKNAYLGNGSNAQENCYIVNSTYDGLVVTAHGGKVRYAHLGTKVFVGFNSFIHGTEAFKIDIGSKTIVMPHTIIDAEEPIKIPENSLVWGYITKQADIATQSMDLDALQTATDLTIGDMTFKGDGRKFVDDFKHRIEHILEANGAYFQGSASTQGHAQKNQAACFNILQPFHSGPDAGMHPYVVIKR